MSNKELSDFLHEQCREKGLSLRSLSINSGLSAGTVHNIIHRKYQPTLFSLNQLADYLRVRRQYLWQLAGLLEDMDYDLKSTLTDPQLKFHFARIDRLPAVARTLIISLIEAVITFLEAGGQILQQGRTFTISGDNKGLVCPFEQIVCQMGYCEKCETYLHWRLESPSPAQD